MSDALVLIVRKEDLDVLTHKADFNERQIRIFNGWMANLMGRGGQKRVAELTRSSTNTVQLGQRQIAGERMLPASGRVRREGGGRKNIESKYPGLQGELREIVEKGAFDDDERMLFWTTKSLRELQEYLKKIGYNTSHVTIGRLLEDMEFNKLKNKKFCFRDEQQIDKDAQFRLIEQQARINVSAGNPVISMNNIKNINYVWCKKVLSKLDNNKMAEKELNQDILTRKTMFNMLKELSSKKIYSMNENLCFVNLESQFKADEFRAESVSAWWHMVGKATFGKARRIYITCEGGEKNGHRMALWLHSLAELAEKEGIEIQVSHFPPGTFKWNTVDHRMFFYNTLEDKHSFEILTQVSLVGNPKTKNSISINDAQHTVCPCESSPGMTSEHVDVVPVGEFEKWNYIVRGFKR